MKHAHSSTKQHLYTEKITTQHPIPALFFYKLTQSQQTKRWNRIIAASLTVNSYTSTCRKLRVESLISYVYLTIIVTNFLFSYYNRFPRPRGKVHSRFSRVFPTPVCFHSAVRNGGVTIFADDDAHDFSRCRYGRNIAVLRCNFG